MTRYEPYCDCLGGHAQMIPDPNGRWCRAGGGTTAERDLLQRAVDLIEGDLVGSEWKRACRAFIKDARSVLSEADHD